MRITGRVLEVERTQRVQATPQGPETYTQETLHVLSGREVTPVRVARNFPEPTPAAGDDVDLAVMIRPWSGNNGPQYTVTALRTYDPAALSLVAAS